MRVTKKTFLIPAIFAVLAVSSHAIGISTSIFMPRNGSLSHPVSPLSLRDIGVTFGNYVGAAGSLILYNIGGMGFTGSDGQPLSIEGAASGPFYSILASVVLKGIIPISIVTLEPSGGLFGYYLLNPSVRSGSIDAYIASREGHTTVDSTLEIQGRWGWGYVFGGSFTVKISSQIGIQAGVLYYIGSSALGLTGSYLADGTATANPIPSYLLDGLLDYTGLEVSIGVEYEL